MDKFENYIDKVIQKVLTEAAEQKASEVSEKLHGKQKEIDKNKNGKKHTKEGFEDEIDIDRMDLNPPEEDLEIGEFDPRDKSWEEIKAHTGAPDYSEIDEMDVDPEYIDPKDGELDEVEANEAETAEGNAFTGALAKAKEEGKNSFEVDGKKFNVKEAEDKWIQKTKMKKGALHKKLGVPEGSKIPKSKLNSLKKELTAKAKGDKKLSAEDLKTLKQVNMALTLGGLKESKFNLNSLQLNENELIDLIEKIVVEQEVNKTKGNIADKTPKGLEVAEKVHREDGKENKSALEAVTKKLREYLKDASKGNFEPNPKNFPKGNGELAKMDKKAYTPDADVEEYIEEFSYGGGMENLDYDEIKPNEEWMENTIVGSSKTGNSQKYANAVETELGEKINNKRKKNIFSQEKKNSYKRVDQPTSGDNKSKGQKDSDKLFAKLESTEDKNNKLVVEQLEKMKHLFSYSQKTQ